MTRRRSIVCWAQAPTRRRPTNSARRPSMRAWRQCHLAAVRALLAAGADPKAQEAKGGQTALMWAVSQHQSAVTEELVRHGADVNARSKTGFTALMFAAQQGD